MINILKKNNKGYTLLELIISLFILSIVSFIIFFSINNNDYRNIKTNSFILTQNINFAQKLAISSNDYIYIKFYNDKYEIKNSKNELIRTVNFNKNIYLNSINTKENKINYTNLGTTGDACTIVLQSKKYKSEITVTVGSGKPTIKKIYNI